MLTNPLQEVLQKVETLTDEEKIQLITEIEKMLPGEGATTRRPRRSIMEFRGLGKELWQEIDVDKYIEEERNSWDG